MTNAVGGTLAFELYDESNVDTVTTVEDSENMDERPGHESGDTGATRLRELQPHVDTDLNLNTARHSNGKVYYLERNEQRESNEVSVVELFKFKFGGVIRQLLYI